MAKKTITSADMVKVPCTYSGTCRGAYTDKIQAVTLTPYGESIVDKLKRGDGPVIGLENGKNYIEFEKYMELERERNNYKALSEEREENCWALAKVVDEKEKEIKRLNEKIKDLQDKLEVSDKSEDYRWERCNEAERKLLKIECFIKDKDYPYEK